MNIPALIGVLVYAALGGAVAFGLTWVFYRAVISVLQFL